MEDEDYDFTKEAEEQIPADLQSCIEIDFYNSLTPHQQKKLITALSEAFIKGLNRGVQNL